MYLIYECSHKCSLSNSPFNIATQSLLKELDLSFRIPISEIFLPHGGYYGRVSNFSKFLFANIYNIALAAKNGDVLLALEEDSYCNLAHALRLLEYDSRYKDFIINELSCYNINVNIESLGEHVAYLPLELEKNKELIKQKIKFHFGHFSDFDSNNAISAESIPSISKRYDSKEGFSTCLYYTGRHFDCIGNITKDSNNKSGGQRSDLDSKYLDANTSKSKNSNIDSESSNILDLVGLKSFESSFSMESFCHLLDFNKTKACEKSGEILYEGIDLGVDFICVFGDSVFNMFDKSHVLCSKHCRRDDINIPVMNVAQILLVAFDKVQKAGFWLHEVNPMRLFENYFKVS